MVPALDHKGAVEQHVLCIRAVASVPGSVKTFLQRVEGGEGHELVEVGDGTRKAYLKAVGLRSAHP